MQLKKPTYLMELIFATANNGKLKEVQALMPAYIKLLSLTDAGITEEIPEDYDTLEANAQQKAKYVYDKTGIACFADDTGMFVDALDGRPGVYSARYAGPQKCAADNMNKIIAEMQDAEQRTAQFKTVIAFCTAAETFYFTGLVEGEIIRHPAGSKGFGYDPIFAPNNYMGLTYAQMDIAEKNKMSHRALAIESFIGFLESHSPGKKTI
jgi:XTP/dITP diphosphohydrolase